ncbi:MAG: biotin transporter BioY [Faecalimonas sp.]|nr:biotin transporter BioY [Faecalimonas sp.]
MTKKFSKIQELCVIGLFTALICVIAPISIPMPLGVPLTLQTFILSLIAIILGAKRGASATLIYILLGAFGLPVFSNFTGGWQIITGPTGGFILSFPLMTYLVGLGVDNRSRFKGCFLICVLLGNMINLLCGTAMFCFLSKSTFIAGLTACVIPFLPITIIKIVLSWVLGLNIKRRIVDW